MLYVPRLLSGFGIGMLSMCSPVYIAELAPEHRRGQLATLWQLAITTGIVFVSILNIWLAEWDEGWRVSYGGNILFSVILGSARDHAGITPLPGQSTPTRRRESCVAQGTFRGSNRMG